MASNPTGPPRLPREPSGEDDRLERYGTVSVARHVKDDGRALILYAHAEDEPT
jgi:hypothetical protein